MDQEKITNLARSFSSSCKQLANKKPWLKQTPSPVVTLVAMTVLKTMLLDVGLDKRPGWGFQV
jgi:hypothetical protein